MKDPEDKVDWRDFYYKNNPFLSCMDNEYWHCESDDIARRISAERAVDAAWEKNR